MNPAPRASVAETTHSVFSDGFGPRYLTFDTDTGEPVEILSFDPALIEAPEFASAVGARVARLASVRHMLYARVRRLDRPAPDALLLVSDHVAGWRLADVLDIAERETLSLDISAVLSLLRQLIPAVALFGRHQRDFTIGAIGPERLIVTPNGRMVLAEYVLGAALEKLAASREHLWSTYRVAVPATGEGARVSPRADVLGIGIVVLALLLGRRLRDDEFPARLGKLLQKATESSGGNVRPLSGAFGGWLARALQLDERTAFQSPQEAHVAFEEMLASERGYVTTPALLDAFLARFAAIAGAPPEPVRPPAPAPPEPPPPEPAAEPTPPLAAPPAEAAPSPSVAAPAPITAAAEPGAAPLAIEEAPAASPASPGVAIEEPPVAEPEAPPVGPSTAIPPAGIPEPAEPSAVRVRVGEDARRWMTGAIAAFALLVVIEAVAIIWLWNSGSADTLTGEGELVVQTRPAAARVSVDGQERGVTPLTIRLSPGAHVMQVRVGDAEPRVIPLQIRAGVQTAQYIELQGVAATGAVEIRSDPPRARVSIDGQDRGLTPIVVRDLTPGDHEVVISAGGREEKRVIRVEAGVTGQLVVAVK